MPLAGERRNGRLRDGHLGSLAGLVPCGWSSEQICARCQQLEAINILVVVVAIRAID